MPIDLSALSPEASAAYILVGRQFGSPDTTAQANQTLKGLSTYAAELVQHGFAVEDGARLADARDALVAAGADDAVDVGFHDDLQHALRHTAQEIAVTGLRHQLGQR